MAEVATVPTVIDVAGNTAIDLYATTNDPENEPLTTAGLSLQPLALANLGTIQIAACTQRRMSQAEIMRQGGKLSDWMEKSERSKAPTGQHIDRGEEEWHMGLM